MREMTAPHRAVTVSKDAEVEVYGVFGPRVNPLCWFKSCPTRLIAPDAAFALGILGPVGAAGDAKRARGPLEGTAATKVLRVDPQVRPVGR